MRRAGTDEGDFLAPDEEPVGVPPAADPNRIKASKTAPPPSDDAIKLQRIQITENFAYYYPDLVPVMGRMGVEPRPGNMASQHFLEPYKGVSKENLLAVKSILLDYKVAELREIQKKLGPDGFEAWLNYLHRLVEIAKVDGLISKDGMYLLTKAPLFSTLAKTARPLNPEGEFALNSSDVALMSKVIWSIRDHKTVLGLVQREPLNKDSAVIENLKHINNPQTQAMEKLRWLAARHLLSSQGEQGIRLGHLNTN